MIQCGETTQELSTVAQLRPLEMRFLGFEAFDGVSSSSSSSSFGQTNSMPHALFVFGWIWQIMFAQTMCPKGCIQFDWMSRISNEYCFICLTRYETCVCVCWFLH